MVSGENRHSFFQEMARIRVIEEGIAEKYSDQEMRCPVHLSIGQEGIAVGVSAALRPDDMIITNHRSHAHYLAKGGSLKSMLAELHGKEDGCARGRGGSMHLIDLDAGIPAALPIVAGSIPIGVGIALANKRSNSDRVTVIYVGDAALEEGVFHESANFAALKNLPVLFVCENNLYSVYTPLAQRQPLLPLSRFAQAHGIPTHKGDGNDVREVNRLAVEAVQKIRDKSGPIFLELDTYRWREHCGPNYDNHIGYRTEDEAEHWMALCPIERERALLNEEGLLTTEHETRIYAELASEFEDAIEFARSAPLPDSADAGKYVYA